MFCFSLSEQVPETASSEGKLLVESPPVVRRSERNNRAMFSLVVAEGDCNWKYVRSTLCSVVGLSFNAATLAENVVRS